MFGLKRIWCKIFGHVDIELNKQDGYGYFAFVPDMCFYFTDRYGTIYTKKIIACQRCGIYEKIQIQNKLTPAEQCIKDIIT